MSEPSREFLATKLCPWLAEPLARCSGALASDRLGHAWLIHGIAGIGKLNLAHVLARRLLTPDDVGSYAPLEPSELLEAMSTRYQLGNHHPDLHYVFPEETKSTIGVEQIRAVCDELSLKSFAGAAKVVILEPAEAMTVAASNALLKTLEQPSPQSYLLLVSHCPGRLPATIRSRCQRIAVRGPGLVELIEWAQLSATDTPRTQLEQAARGRSPLELAHTLTAQDENSDATYARELADVAHGRADPIAVADAWAKRDVGHVLDWLVRRLQLAIRERSLARGSTGITDSGEAGRHTAAEEGLSLRACFEQLDRADALRNQLGGGINVQLALRALLLAFRSPREST